MTRSAISYKISHATEEQVYQHLQLCSHSYIPPLNSRLDIKSYSKKIIENAITFEAWEETILVGLIAAYFNSSKNQEGFITNVSVLNGFVGKGIANELMNQCILYATQNNFETVRLEVNRQSHPAIGLYKKFHFTEIHDITAEEEEVMTMVVNI